MMVSPVTRCSWSQAVGCSLSDTTSPPGFHRSRRDQRRIRAGFRWPGALLRYPDNPTYRNGKLPGSFKEGEEHDQEGTLGEQSHFDLWKIRNRLPGDGGLFWLQYCFLRGMTRAWARPITCTYDHDPNTGELRNVAYSDSTPAVRR